MNAVFHVASFLFRSQTARLEAHFSNRRVMLDTGLMFRATNVFYLVTQAVTNVMLIRFFSGVCFAVDNTRI